MSDNLATTELLGKRFVFSLSLAVFGTGMLDVLASLLLMDITKTFLGNSDLISVAIVSQIATFSSIAAITFGLLNGFLSVKINHKLLLLFGIVCIFVGAIGCYLAPSLLFMAIFYPFDGIGTIIVGAMAFTLIGELLPLEKRAKSISIVTAGGISSSAISYISAGYFMAVGGWHSYLLWYVLPISLVAIGLSYLFIPQQLYIKNNNETINVKSSLKEVFANKSSATCLLGYTLMAVTAVWTVFAATYWRTQFSIQVQDVGLITLALLIMSLMGSLFAGRIIDSAGRKRIVVLSWLARGILIGSIVFMPSFLSAFVMSCLAMFTVGITATAGHSFILEQVKKSKGTMMSITGVFASIGLSTGIALGGFVLATFGFQLLGITLASFGVIAASAIFFFAKDPTQKLD